MEALSIYNFVPTEMKKWIPKILFIAILLIMGNSFICSAQDRYKDKPWLVSCGINLIIEDGNQFTGFANNEKIIWNISPFTFFLEKRLAKGFGIQGVIGSNIYATNQKINGLTLEVPRDVVYTDLFGKFNFNSIWKDTSSFDPYLGIGPGYIFTGNGGEATGNICFGFNQWVGRGDFAISLEGIYKFKVTLTETYTKDNIFQINLSLLHLID
jgi:hypothetical protein